MRNNSVIVALLCLLSFLGYAQFEPDNTKFTLGTTLFGSSPLIFKNETPTYRYSKGELKKNHLSFRYGVSLYGTRKINNQLNIGAEISYKSFDLSIQKYINEWFTGENTSVQNYYHLRAEAVDFNVYSALVRFEIFQKNGNNPLGLYQAISFGYSRIHFADKSYYLSVNEFGEGVEHEQYWTTPQKTHFYLNWPDIHGITLHHEVGMRYPITKHITLNFGTKTILGFEFGKSYKKQNLSNLFFDYEDFYYDMRRLNLFSFNLQAGITYLF